MTVDLFLRAGGLLRAKYTGQPDAVERAIKSITCRIHIPAFDNIDDRLAMSLPNLSGKLDIHWYRVSLICANLGGPTTRIPNTFTFMLRLQGTATLHENDPFGHFQTFAIRSILSSRPKDAMLLGTKPTPQKPDNLCTAYSV